MHWRLGPPHFDRGQNVPPEGGSLYGLLMAGLVWLMVVANT